MAERQVAVLIDYENVGLGSIQWLFDQISDVGRVIIRRAYADWSDERNKRDQLLELGIEPIHVFQSGSGKNLSDIRLAIDAVDLLYQSPVDTFVIVSSDADFAPLVSKLRAGGKMVIGAGRRRAVSKTLVLSVDRFCYLDDGDVKPAKRGAPQKQREESLLVRAVKASVDAEGRVGGSKLHETLQRLDPSFNFRAQGYSTFTRYLEASPEVRATRPKGPGDVTVELMEPAQGTLDGTPDPETWAPKVDAEWSKRASTSGQSIPGTAAAASAAQVLGITKLSVSPYKTLQRLLDASDHLSSRWSRDGNKIIRR